MFRLSRAPVGMMCLLRLFTFWTLIVMASTTIPAGATSLNAKPVPEMSFNTLDGATLALSRLRGTVVLINFWGTWCRPCLQEIPELVRLSHQFKARGLTVVGIAVDSGLPDDIRTFMIDQGMDYTVLTGELGLVKRHFQVMGFPTSLLIDRQGLMHKRYFGPQTFEVLKHDVELLLQQTQ